MDIEIRMGANSSPLREQIERQGFKVRDPVGLRAVQDDMTALLRLWIRGVIAESAYNKGAKKLCDTAARHATR